MESSGLTEGYTSPLSSEDFDSGRYNNASEVVRTTLRKLQETAGEVFPAGSLKHLYTREENAAEAKLAKRVRIPKPGEV